MDFSYLIYGSMIIQEGLVQVANQNFLIHLPQVSFLISHFLKGEMKIYLQGTKEVLLLYKLWNKLYEAL